jgi:hypothetical protein
MMDEFWCGIYENKTVIYPALGYRVELFLLMRK